MTFGKRTLIKFVGGQIIARDAGQDFAKLQKDIKGITRRGNDMRKPLAAFVKVLFAQEERVFDARGIPRWQPLKPNYEAWKKATHPGQPQMVLSGRTKASLTGFTSDTIFDVQPRSLKFGSHAPQSVYNQDKFPHVVVLPESMEILSRMCIEHMLNPGKPLPRSRAGGFTERAALAGWESEE